MSIARHTIYNVVGALVPAATSLITVPIYLRSVGLDRYGLLALCWLLVGYFSLFDFGVGRATAQQMAKLHSSAVERNRAFWTGMSISTAFAVLAMVLSTPLAPAVLRWMHVTSPDLRLELWRALPLLAFAVPIAIIQSVLRGALEGRREFLTVNVLFSVAAVATSVLPLLAAILWGPQLDHLIATSLAVRVTLLITLAIACSRMVPVGRYQLPGRDEVRSTMRFGAWLTVTNIVGPLMVIADRFFIGGRLGPAAVALYVIPFNLISQLLVVPGALGNALFPNLAASTHSPALNRKALLATSFFVTVASSIAVALIGPFLRLWIGSRTAEQSTGIALALIVGAWANALAQIPHVSLQANGRTDVTAKVHIAEVVPYLLLLWVALSYLGIVGAAIAWSARAIIDFAALAWFDGVGKFVLQRTLLQGIPVLALSLVALTTQNSSVTQWILFGVISLGMSLYLCQTLPPDILQRFSKALR